MSNSILPISRRADWPLVLDEFVKSRERTPFAWGAHDCCSFAADAAFAMTGHDFIAPFRGAYVDELGALAIIAAHGGLRMMASALLGLPLDTVLRSHRGDVGLVPAGADGCEAIGLCDGQQWVLPGARGLLRGSLSAAVAAWRV